MILVSSKCATDILMRFDNTSSSEYTMPVIDLHGQKRKRLLRQRRRTAAAGNDLVLRLKTETAWAQSALKEREGSDAMLGQ
jgi:hypothetical protein